jgi:glyoxylase-like metal-dependent hydrolase (beta-lactamase superfamily II)
MLFGDYRVEVVPDTEFWLDGGAMFGVVPRNLWSKVCPPDDQNRIRLNMNCLFVEAGSERILIDTGIGEKWSAKQASMYGIRRERPLAETLRDVTGISPEEITIVCNTHLHFDHAGGNTRLNTQGEVEPAFPNARYLVARDELEHAEKPTERDRASYLPDNWRPLLDSGQLEPKDGDYEVVPNLTMQFEAGHNRSMRCPKLSAGDRTLFGFADIVPTRAHVPLPWIMGYDLYPVETLESKKKLLAQAAREAWTCLFYHDAEAALARILNDNGTLKPEALHIN